MPSPSPVCTVSDNGGAPQSTTNGVNITPTTTTTITLASTAGVTSWSLLIVSSDELVAIPTVTVNSSAKTATLTAPAAGSALIFQSMVNAGRDVNGVVNQGYTTTFEVHTLLNGNRVLAANETVEGNASFGWISKINPILRTGGAGSGVPYTVSPAGAIASGKVVASYSIAGAAETVQLATPAVLQAVNAIKGIATSSGASGSTITVAPLGSKVLAAVTGLGAGSVARCGISAAGDPVRLTLSTSGFEIGTANASGDIALDGFSAIKQSSLQVYNPARYGAVYRDSSAAAAKRNLVAINKIFGEFRLQGVPNRIACVDQLYVSDSIQMPMGCSFETFGSGNGSAGGPSGIYLTSTIDEGIHIPVGASGATIDDLSIIGPVCTSTPLWLPNHAYNRGDICRVPLDNRYILRCVEGGTSTNGTIPNALLVPDAVAPPRFSFGATYAVGEVIQPSRHEGDTYTDADSGRTHTGVSSANQQYGRLFYQITTANGSTTPGVFGAVDVDIEPIWPTSAGGTVTSGNITFTAVTMASQHGAGVGLDVYLRLADNTVVWMPEDVSGVVAHGKVDLCRLNIQNFPCSAIHLYTVLDDLPLHSSNCNGSNISHCFAINNGNGMIFEGFNTNSVLVYGCFVYNAGIDGNTSQRMPGCGGVGFLDNCVLGVSFKNCLIQDVTGPGYVSSTLGDTVFDNCYSDGNNEPSLYRNGCVQINGSDTGSLSNGTNTVIGGTAAGAMQVKAQDDRLGPVRLSAHPLMFDGHSIMPWTSAHEASSNYFATRKDDYFPGWYVTGYYQGSGPLTFIEGISGTRAPEGRANKWVFDGRYEGATKQLYIGADNAFLTKGSVRYGARVVGDTWRANVTAQAGDYTHKQVVTAGYIATTTRTNGLAISADDYYNGICGAIISGGDGYAYLVTKGGVTGTSPPTFTGSTLLGPRAQVWTANTPLYPGNLMRPTAGTNTYYAVPTPTPWSASLNVSTNQLITPSSANGDVFKLNVPLFAPNTSYEIGNVVQPSNKSGTLAMVVVSVVDRSVAYTARGQRGLAGAEPTWPVVAGSSVTTTYGAGYSVTFKAVQMVTGTTEPVWGLDNAEHGFQPRWTGVTDGKVLTLADYADVTTWTNARIAWTKVQLKTGGVEPVWGSSLVDGTGDGQFTWVSQGTFNAASLISDSAGGGTVVYTRIGALPTYANTGAVEDPVVNIEGRAHTSWGTGPLATVPGCTVDSTRSFLATTNATANQIIETYTLPVNTAECVDYVVVAKLLSGTGSACWKINVGVERGATTATVTINLGATLVWNTGGLSALTAASVTAAASGTTGAVDLRVTGIAATNIDWASVRQSVGAT